MEKLILEITQPKTNVKKIVKIESFPVTIGRGYSNDIILPDEYVSQKHLKIDNVEGKLTIIDLDSENGLFINKERVINEVSVDFEQVFQLGKSKIRILKPDHKLAPARKLDINKSFIEKYKIVITAWATLIFLLILKMIDTYNHTYEEVEIIKLMKDWPSSIGICLILAGVFSVIGKISKKDSCFHMQLFLVTLISLSMELEILLKDLILFNFPSSSVETILTYLIVIPINCYLMIKIFQYSTNVSLKNLRIVLTSIFYIIAMLMSFNDYSSAIGFSSKPSYMRNLLPKYFKVRKTISLEEFRSDSIDLFEQTDISD